MDAAQLIAETLRRANLTKSALSARAGVSRALLDDYLKGTKQPSLPQLRRVIEAAGLALRLDLQPVPRPAPEAFAAVLEFGDMFPRKDPEPLVDLSDTWRKAAERV